jgi:hypothetical protein
MRKIIICLSVFLAIFFHSCKEQHYYTDCEPFSLDDISQKLSLTGEIMTLEDVYRPVNLYVQDSILFMINSGEEYFLRCYNLINNEKIGEFITFGSGPSEVFGLKSLQFVDSSVWGFDKQRKRLLQYNITQFAIQEKIDPQTSITIADNLSNRVLIVKDKLFTNSFVHIDSRFSIFDMKGKFIKNVGELPNFGEDMTPHEKLESFFCSLEVRPDNELIFLSYWDTDLIEIYDKEGSLKERRHGPDHFFPAKKEINAKEGSRVLNLREKSRDAYSCSIAFQDEIWNLYSGKIYDPNNSDHLLKNKIIVFDWNGKPLRMYTTDIPIGMFTVDKDNKTIYGITINPDFSIVKFKY